jgi:tetratricopeptide (TPR) repeat protein
MERTIDRRRRTLSSRAVLGAAILSALLTGLAFAARERSEDKPDELSQAEEAWENGDRIRAAALAKKIEQKKDEGERSARVALLLARCASDPDESLERWEEVLALTPTGEVAAEAHWNRAQAASAMGLHSQAIEEYVILARDHKSHFDRGRALLGKGLAELQSGEPADALETLGLASRFAKRHEDTIAAELALASATYQLGNVREALRRYEKFENDHSKDERARWAAWRAVLCLRLLGRESDAAEKTERMEREYPGSIEAVLAREEIRMGRVAPEEKKPRTEDQAQEGASEEGEAEQPKERKESSAAKESVKRP